jgi:hypothetical protein
MPALDRLYPGAVIYERRNQTSIFEAYNSIMREHRQSQPLTPLVLMHEDVELRSDVVPLLEREFTESDVAIVGTIGGRGVRSVRWYRSVQRFGRAPDTVNGDNYHSSGAHDVDIADGLFLALSPWAVENLEFDEETYNGFHGYDADICMQARAAGMRVRVDNIDLFHHTKGGFGDARAHRETDDAFRAKWTIPRDSLAHRWRKKLRNRAY